LDFKYNKKIKRHILKKDYQTIKDFDEENDIQLYILNNDVSNIINIYHSLGKKVIGIFHGVFLSCAFENNTLLYRSWHSFNKLDSFVHIIPDDYWIYKKFCFNNSIYIHNIIIFENKNASISNLTYNILLIVGRANDIIKGVKFGVFAMTEIVKEVPDARLTIVGIEPKQNIKDLNLQN
jgi:glycosyltransferase involved in cell wall biosynthesis